MRRLKGFSLIELLVVIAIAGLIIAISATSYSAAQRQARDSRRIQDMKNVQSAFEQFYVVNSSYPNNIDGNIDDAFQSERPVDPKASSTYLFGTSDTEYCVCASLEAGTGNAIAPSGTTCNWNTTGANFCVQNQQ